MIGRWMTFWIAAAALGALAAGPAAVQAQDFEEPREVASGAVISWDQWGVPHIDAQSAVAANYALGWAQAQGRPDQLLELLGQGRGRAAEYWGEDYFEGDALMWRVGIPQALDALFAAQGPGYQARLNGYAAGINAWFAA
ncbi:MAG: penicillin acylase family protein, partial [Sphingomonadales bacterium]|nr:penicillin acylase family protein [Sphingomonadales bacterium]